MIVRKLLRWIVEGLVGARHSDAGRYGRNPNYVGAEADDLVEVVLDPGRVVSVRPGETTSQATARAVGSRGTCIVREHGACDGRDPYCMGCAGAEAPEGGDRAR